MTATVGDIVAQLLTAIRELDAEAVHMRYAQQEAESGLATYAHAARGTADPTMRRAINDIRTAGEKCGKVARLLSIAAGELASYLQKISPSVTPGASGTAAPHGDFLIRSQLGRGAFFRRALGRVHESANADDGVEGFRTTGNLLQRAAANPTGMAVRRSPSAEIPPEEQRPGAGDILLGALVLAVVSFRAAGAVVRLRDKRGGDRPATEGTDHSA